MYGPLQLHSLRLCWHLFTNQCFMIDQPFLQALSISWFSNILPIIGDSYTLIFFAPAMSPAWCQHWRQSNRIIVSCRQGPRKSRESTSWGSSLLRKQPHRPGVNHWALQPAQIPYVLTLRAWNMSDNCELHTTCFKKSQLPVSAWSIIQLTNPKTAFGIATPIQLNHWK